MTGPDAAAGGADAADSGPGPVGEEAARLLEALQGWMATGAAAAGLGASEECRLCPVCQLIRVLQTTRPEVAEHLGDAAVSLTAALRSAIETAQQSWTSGPPRAAQKIDID